MATQINLIESIRKLDVKSNCKYELSNLYEAVRADMSLDEKKALAIALYENVDAKQIYGLLNNKYTLNESVCYKSTATSQTLNESMAATKKATDLTESEVAPVDSRKEFIRLVKDIPVWKEGKTTRLEDVYNDITLGEYSFVQTALENIPDTAVYKFSAYDKDDTDIDFYVDDDGMTWYAANKSKDECLTEDADDEFGLEDWEMRADRFDDPESPYYNADLDDDDFDDFYGDDEDDRFEFITRKQVEDSDGFNTDYTMYYDKEEKKYVFVFGDSDIYHPINGDYDFETESEAEAYDWFANYKGFAEDDKEFDESLKESTIDKKAIEKKFFHNSHVGGGTWDAVDLTDEEMAAIGHSGKKVMADGKEHNFVSLDDNAYRNTFNEGYSVLNRYDPRTWSEEDIELHKSIDWQGRGYADYPVDEDSFEGEVVKYSTKEDPEFKTVTFVKYLRANSLFPPYYAPKEKPFDGVVGPMYDGHQHGMYDIHDRYETQEAYDLSFD